MKMKTNYFILSLIALGFLSPAIAQPGNRGSRGNSSQQTRSSNTRTSSATPRQNNTFSRNDRSVSPRQQQQPSRQNSAISRNDRSVNTRQQQPTRQSTDFRGQTSRSTSNADRIRGNSNTADRIRSNNNSSIAQRGNNRGPSSSYGTTNRINTYRSNTGYIANRGGSYYGNNGGIRISYNNRYSSFPRRYSYTGYQRYSILPRTSISISFGGYPYYYDRGYYYSNYNGFYEPVFAPFGIRVTVLPYGYYPFYIGPTRYYYYGGTYYRNYNNNQYEVIDAPLGAVIYDLPRGAKVAVVNGEEFYEFNGTYYKEGRDNSNRVMYTVAGKYGEINNSGMQYNQPIEPSYNRSAEPQYNNKSVEPTYNTAPQNNPADQEPLRIGDIITTLPSDCRAVTIDGQTLYVTPDNTYFKTTKVNGETWYEVVGADGK